MYQLATQLLSNRSPSWCMMWHTSTFMEHHITNIKNIDAVVDTYSEENILKALKHQQHWNDPRTRVGDGNTPITNWNSGFVNNEEKKSCSLSAAHTFPRLSWAERCYWVSASRPCSPTKNVTSQHLSIATIKRWILLYITQTTKPGLTTPMFALLSELWGTTSQLG